MQSQDYRSIVAFLHCFTGCDCTSGFTGKGKKTTVDSLITIKNLKEFVKPFYEPDSDPTIIAKNGCAIIAALYNCKKASLSLDDFRYNKYRALTRKNSFKLEKLPPTTGAATQHSYRAYFQLQNWLGNKLNATKWGWNEVLINNSKVLMPRYTNIPMLPEQLLKTISCGCNGDCSKNNCGCRKHGLKCTDLCTKCQDSGNCCNMQETVEDDDSSDSEDAVQELPSISLDTENEQIEEFSDVEDDFEDEDDIESHERSGNEDEGKRRGKKRKLQ